MITENDLLKKLLVRVNMPTCRNIAISITRYLSQQQINDFCEAFRDNKSGYFWIQLMKTMRFINSYVNGSDRSLYFTFYDQEQYKKIEIQHIAAISQTHSKVFLCHEQQFESTLALIKQKMPDVESQFQLFKNTLTNPDLPMPKLKRETQGMFCTSPFQLFLVCSTFQEYDEEDLYTCFQQIKEYFSIEKQEKYLKQYMTIMKDKSSNNEMLKKIKKVRFTPYEITANNIHQFMLEDNQLHNMIVGLFALTDIMVKTTRQYIQLIKDPLHRLVELTLRYNIYRNYVLAVEEQLSFVFKMYNNIYKETIEEGVDRPNYRFWRAALSKWFLYMNELHRESEEVYMFCLTKLRNNKLKVQIQEKYSQDRQLLDKFLQVLEQSQFEYELGCRILKGKSINLSEVGTFFDQHPQNYQIVVMEFNEYLVDISVNQQTVHWCGHTKQQMQQPYLDYEQYLISVSNEYFKKLLQQQIPLKKQEISMIAEIDLDYLSTLQIKNRTLIKLKQIIRKQYNLQENLAISAEFEEADKKLEYFNHKALILAEIDPNNRPFYSIPPHFCPDKIIDMLQETNDSSNNHSESEKIQYDSEDQTQEAVQNVDTNPIIVKNQVTIQNADKKPVIVKSYPKYHSDNEEQDISKQLSLTNKQIKTSKVFLQQEEIDYLNTSAEYDQTVKEAKN